MILNQPYPSPRKAGFHRVAISSTEGGFLPPQADFVEKSTCSRKCFFLCKGYEKDIFRGLPLGFKPE